MYRFIKTGAYAGKTVNLGGYQFIDGVYTLAAEGDGPAPSVQDCAQVGDYLAKCYQAYLEGSAELAAAEAGSPPEGDKKTPEQDPAKARATRIRNALLALDPAVDDHWTGQGLPSVEAVRDAVKEDVSRADISSVAPKLTREEAQKAKDAGGTDPLDA